nr:hypothetical protein CFP56_75638 [Quercus suber]
MTMPLHLPITLYFHRFLNSLNLIPSETLLIFACYSRRFEATVADDEATVADLKKATVVDLKTVADLKKATIADLKTATVANRPFAFRAPTLRLPRASTLCAGDPSPPFALASLRLPSHR